MLLYPKKCSVPHCCSVDWRNVMPPATPTPNTYNQPWVKSNKWECTIDEMAFSTTTTVPTQAVQPAEQNKRQCAVHMASSTAAPAKPSCMATPNIWLCGLTVATPTAPVCPTAERRNRSAI